MRKEAKVIKHLGDIKGIRGDQIPAVDCITFGAPCQDLSVAGYRAGMKHEDNGDEETTRSGLFFEAVRVIKEMRENDRRSGRTGEYVRPRYAVYENVPGAFSSNSGKDFQAVLTEIARIADPSAPPVPIPENGRWPHAGCIYGEMGNWSIAYRLTDAQYWGTPQRRKRVALAADFAGLSAIEIMFDPQLRRVSEVAEHDKAKSDSGAGRRPKVQSVAQGVSGDSEQGREAGPCAAGCVGGGASETGGTHAISFQERAGKPGGGKGILIQNEHTGALSTLNIQHIFQPVTFDARGNGDGTTVNTITGDHNDRVTDYTALVLSFKQGNGSKARGIGLAENVSPSLVSSESGTNMVPVVLPFDTTQITSPNNYSSPKVGDPCHPLAATAHPPAVAIGNGQLHNISMEEIGNTLDTMHDAQAILVPDTAHALHAKANCQHREDSETYLVDNPGTVRRLTPTECARLQGFPDDWIEVGEWVDGEGKKHRDANTHKYKAYGNSIAVGYANNGSGFWMWLLKRISAQYERNATLGSLFDGIGGFPLAWEHFNGEGSALWASEIEPFPIAVTKMHFSEDI